ncbi:hypothetical protein ACWGJ9_09370 [Curtobacterium citreum]
MHLWKKLLATTALSVALLGLAPAGIASATPSDAPTVGHVAVTLVNTADADKNSWKDIGCGSADDSNCLPYKRWMPATQAFHGRFDGFGGMAATSYQVQAGVSSSMMSTGNLLYSLGGSIVGLADSVNILQVAGKDVNKGFAAIGNAFLSSPFAALIAVFAVGGIMMGLMRGRSVARRLISTAIVLGLMVAMVTGASAGASKGSATNAAGCASVNSFGVMSPAWMANLTSTASCAVTQGIASSLNTVVDGMSSDNDTFLNQGTCAAYVDRLVQLAKDKTKPSQTELQINSSWMNSGLAAWAQTQYGNTPRSDSDDGDNSDAPLMADSWCHQADVNTGRKAANQILLTYETKDVAKKVGAYSDGKFATRAPAWIQNADDKDDDRALVSWAACKWDPSKGTVEVRKGFTDEASGSGLTKQQCIDVITNKDADLGKFDYPGSTGDIQKKFSKDNTSAADFKADVDYLTSLHGNNLVTNGSGPMFAYLLSAIAFCVVFILLGCVVLVAKLAAGVMTVGLIFVLIKCLLGNAGWDPMVKFGKQFISFSVLAAASSLLLALVSMVTKIIQNVGVGAVGGPGSIFGLVWVGIAPLLAVIMLHLMFKKLSIASPFTPAGVMSYAAAAGGGQIAGAGLVNRLQSRAAGAPGRAGRAGMGLAGRGLPKGEGAAGAAGVAGGAGALGLGAKGRSGRMTPLGTAGAAGGIGAAGVAGAAGATALGVAKGKRGLSGKAAAVSGIETPGATGLLGPAGTAGDRAQAAVSRHITKATEKTLSGFEGAGKRFKSAVGAAKGSPARIALGAKSGVAAVRRAPSAAKSALNSGKGATVKAIGFARGNYRNPEFWKGAGSAALAVSKSGAAATGRGLAAGAKAAPGVAVRYAVDGTVGAARGLSAAHAATRPGRRALLGAAAGALTGDVRNVARGAAVGHKAGRHINGVQKAKRTDIALGKVQAGREAAQAQFAAQRAELKDQKPKAPELPQAPSSAGVDAAAHARSIAEGKVQAAAQRLADNSAGASVADWKSMKAEKDAAEAHRANMDAAHQREVTAYQAAQAAHQQAVAPAAEAHAAAKAAHKAQVKDLEAEHTTRLEHLDAIGSSKNVAKAAARAERADIKQARALAAAERKSGPAGE